MAKNDTEQSVFHSKIEGISSCADASTRGVSICKLFGFNHNVQRGCRIMAVVTQGKVLHDIEHVQRSHALLIGRELANRPSSVAAAQRLDPFRFKFLKVCQRMQTALFPQKVHKALAIDPAPLR